MAVKVLYVVAGIIVNQEGKILLTQRPQGKSFAGLWEFPGGKIEENESPEQALVRELSEELALFTDAKELTPLTFASHDYGDFHLLMPIFLCKTFAGDVRPQEGQRFRWVDSVDFDQLPMLPADEPILPIIRKLLSC